MEEMKLQTMPLRFRVWDTTTNKFLENDELLDFFNGFTNFYDSEMIMSGGRDFIISQDTGLKDKNGKSIYTGDIVKINGYYVFVDFDYGCTFFENQRKGIAQDSNRASLYDKTCAYIDGEMVGNIWQNKELLSA